MPKLNICYSEKVAQCNRMNAELEKKLVELRQKEQKTIKPVVKQNPLFKKKPKIRI